MYTSTWSPCTLFVPPPQLPSLRPVLSRIPPPSPPLRHRVLQNLFLLLLPLLTRLAHQGHEELRTLELFRKLRSRPLERVLGPQSADLLDLLFVEMVRLRIRFPNPGRQRLVRFFVGVGVAEGLGEELAARVAGGKEYGGGVVDGWGRRWRVEDDVVLGSRGVGGEGGEGRVWFYPEPFRCAPG